MARWAIFDLLNMFFCSTFHALSNRKKNIFVSIEMTTLCNSTFFQRLLHRLLYSKDKNLIFILNRYYGCGLVFPPKLEGCRILDLGSGSGRDVYILSSLVGPKGYVVGVDMTKEQVKFYFISRIIE